MVIYTIVVTYNGLAWLDKCLGSIYSSSINVKAIIIDNGSTDGSIEYIKKYFPQAILIETGRNLGFGKANNLGIEIALKNGCDYVYLLNQDAWLEPKTIETLINIQKTHQEFAILSPLQIVARKDQIDYNFASNFNEIDCPNIMSDLYFKNIKDVYPIKFVMAAHWLISRYCLLKIGGFSPVFNHYGEDNNYLHRIYFHKLKVGVCPNAVAIHDRVNRKTSLKKEAYLLYCDNFLSNVNNINHSFIHCLTYSYFTLFKGSIKIVFKYKTLLPIKYIFKSIFIIPKCIKNRKLTKKEGSIFLN